MKPLNEILYWPSQNFAPWATVWPEALGRKTCETPLSKKNGGYCSFNYLHSGTLELQLGREPLQTVKGGTAFAILPGQLYHYVAAPAAIKETSLFWVRLAGPNAEKHIEAMGMEKETQRIRITQPRKLEEQINQFTASYNNYNATSNAEVVALLYQMIPACNPDFSAEAVRPGSLAARIRDFICDELELGCNISQIAQFFGISRSSLFLHFKREFGTTPISVLKKARLEKARHLLVETDLTVEEIAYASGYSNLSHFLHQFKAEFSTTPSNYRNGPGI